MFVDLSLPLDNSTRPWTGDPPVAILPFYTHDKDGVSVHSYSFSGHTGTHIDAPLHFVPGGKTHADVPIEKYIGQGVLVDARRKSILEKNLLDSVECSPGSIVLFYTAYIDNLKQPDYYENYPVLSEDLAHAMVSAKVKIVGIDSASPDKDPYPVHKILLQNEVLILENLCNLDKLIGKKFRVFAVPIKTPTDGIPLRVFAEIL